MFADFTPTGHDGGKPAVPAPDPVTGDAPTVTATAVTATDDSGHGDTELGGHGH